MNDTSSQLDADGPAPEPEPQGQAESIPPPRVAWVAAEATLEALGRTLQPLAIGLMDELVELTAVVPTKADVSSLPAPPMKVLRHGRLGGWIFETSAADRLAEQLRAGKVELLHALDATAAALARKLARRTHLPYVVSSFRLGDGRRLATRGQRPAAALAASEPIRQDLLSHHVAAAEATHLVRPGVHHVRRATCFRDPRRSIAIVACGAMNRLVPFAAVLQTFAELHDRNYECIFLAIGTGHAEKRLRALAETLHLRDVLTFVARQPPARMPDILEAADIFISPTSGREIDSTALLAMANGVPVLATSQQRSCDFLIDGRTAMLFPEADSSELTVKLTALVDDKAAARSLAESALDYVRRHHGAADMVKAVCEVYRSAPV